MRNPFIPDLPSIFLMQSQTKTLRIPNISTTDHYFTHDVHVTYIYIYSNRLALRILIIYVPAVYYIYIYVNIPIIKPCFCRDPSDFSRRCLRAATSSSVGRCRICAPPRRCASYKHGDFGEGLLHCFSWEFMMIYWDLLVIDW